MSRLKDLRKVVGRGLALIALGLAATLLVRACQTPREAPAPLPEPPSRAPEASPPPTPPPPAPQAAACPPAPAFAAAARANGLNLAALAWSPFGRPERGWETYQPRIAAEIGSSCPAGSEAFAQALARWQDSHGRPADGVLDAADFDVMKGRWQQARPFVRLSARGVCPAPPAPERLEQARANEGYGGKAIRLRSGALAAYRRMVEDARKAEPAIAADPIALQIFSGFRDPDADAARCAREGDCQGVTRARCSAHRTGLAMDIVVGQAPGYPVDSSADPNRLAMSRSPAYRWLVKNAHRYGFANYVFEPWHWEWTGEAP
ncbi:MAG TPA: D-alanyl-D-alanine carboxypeptidase family protein [Phenylobacterium sp.]|nr:D-alanyl-D-alanine carboxypeptidase family protein [Phenylobacterium sp.]